jgi:hypothetical protein
MKNFDWSHVTGDGTLYTNGIIGLISRTRFLDDELPADAIVYLLYHPKRKRHTWILENLSEVTDIPQPRENYSCTNDDTPDIAFVCFCTETEFDYLEFDDDDFDTYIEWRTGHTMQDIINHSNEEE